MTLVIVTACGRANNAGATDNNGAAGENGTERTMGMGPEPERMWMISCSIPMKTASTTIRTWTGDGLLEETGNDANDVVDDLINDVTGDDTMVDGNVDNNGTVNGTGTVGDGAGTDLP